MQGLRALFRWRYSGAVIPLLAGTAVAMALGDRFVPAYMLFAALGAWAVCSWPTSAIVEERKAALGARQVRRNPDLQRRARRSYLLWRFGIPGALCAITLGCLAFVHAAQLDYQLHSLHGWLTPASDPLPPNVCGQVPSDALLLYLGGATSYATRFPHTVIEINGQRRLVIDRNRNGAIAVSVDIFGAEGRIIAELRENEFTINEHNYFKVVRKDRSSLSVFDEYDSEVLSVRYLNPRAIWMNAVLRYPGARPVILSGPGGGGLCVGESGRADIAIEDRQVR